MIFGYTGQDPYTRGTMTDKKTTPATQPKCAGIYASTSWGESWKRDGFNGCITTAIYALRYLSENQRPCGGEQSYNSEHLYDTAGYINDVRDDLIAFHEADYFHPAEALNWPKEWLRDGYNCCLPVVAEALRYLADHPRKREGEQFTAEHLLKLAEDLSITHKTLFDVPTLVVAEKLDKPFERISAANLPEGFVIRDPEEYRKQFEAEFPDVAAIGRLISASGEKTVGTENQPAEPVDGQPRTAAAFVSEFSAQHKRQPTAQEIFEAGWRGGERTAAFLSYRLKRIGTAGELGTNGVIEYNKAIEGAALEARKSGVAQAVSDILRLLLPRKV
jgi:hypothetical protein